jgi:hypothetical protein
VWLGAQWGSQIGTGREEFGGGSDVPMMLSKGLEIELCDFEAANATLKGDFSRQLVEIVIGGVSTILEVRWMCLRMSLNIILWKGCVSMNLFDPMRHQVDLQKVEVGIQLLGKIYRVAHVILLGIHFTPQFGWRPSFGTCFLVYLSLIYMFRSQAIGFGVRLFAGSPGWENSFEGVKTMLGVLHVAQSCIIMRFIYCQ